MKKYTITYVFGIIGALSRSGTILLRELLLSNMSTVNFILGIMPNISASWVFLWLGEKLMNKANRKFTFKAASVVAGVIFLFALISEIIHDMFLNSPFDVKDIIATIVAIILYLTLFYVSKSKFVRGT